MQICYIGIGSNLGNRKRNINLAVKKINSLDKTRVVKFSSIIETIPVGGPAGQGKFLNAALKIITDLSATNLLKRLKQIEKSLGRKKTLRWGARTVDLDILLFGSELIDTKNLQVPHPRLGERDFVLRPLLEII